MDFPKFPDCPKCGNELKKILYGEVIFTNPEAKDHYVLGGCIVPEIRPYYCCKECGIRYDKEVKEFKE